jgi:hypothetical protein
MSWLSCPLCPVQARASVQADLSGRPVQANLSQMSCAILLIPAHGYTVSLSCPSCPVLAVMLWQSCPMFPVLAVLTRPSYLAFLSRLSSPGCPVPAARPCYSSSCLSCPLPATLSTALRTLLSWLVLFVCPASPVYADLSGRTISIYLYGCPVSVVPPQTSYPDCPFMVVPPPLSCPSCPLLAVIFWPSCPLFQSWLYCPDCLLWLSFTGCPVSAVHVPAVLLHPLAQSLSLFKLFIAFSIINNTLILDWSCIRSDSYGVHIYTTFIQRYVEEF